MAEVEPTESTPAIGKGSAIEVRAARPSTVAAHAAAAPYTAVTFSPSPRT